MIYSVGTDYLTCSTTLALLAVVDRFFYCKGKFSMLSKLLEDESPTRTGFLLSRLGEVIGPLFVSLRSELPLNCNYFIELRSLEFF